METTELVFEGRVLEVSAEKLDECHGVLAAIARLGPAIATASEPSIGRTKELEREIPERRRNARLVKLGTLCCGACLVLGFLSDYSRYVGGAILLLAIVDYVYGNHQRLVDALEELAAHRAILDHAKEMELQGINVERHIDPANPKAALDAYADYLTGVQEAITKGWVDVRKRLEQKEAELAMRLTPPEPTVALTAEGDAVKRKDG